MAAPARPVVDAASRIAVPNDAECVILFEERRVVFQANGAARRVYRQSYQVRSQAAAEEWGQVQTTWEPWHEDKPSIDARVVTSDGRSFRLDPKTIETSTLPSGDPDLYSDRSLLRAPLPGIAKGAVVELEVSSQERTPIFDQGTLESFRFIGETPVRKVRLVVDAPDSLPVKFTLTNGTGIERTEKRGNGRVITQFEGGSLSPREPLFPHSPPELFQSSFVTYTTGQSWQRIAERYGQLVDAQLRGADVRAWAQEATQGRKGREAMAAALVARIRREIRYTGIEFGDASIVPRTPAEVFSRRFGDCKDQASLLVTLLRAVGIEAYVALLNAGGRHDVDPAMPGVGLFNHAIVYLPARGANAELWIDPTARFTPVGELPISDQGRLALVARSGTSKLIKTPAAPASANLTREERDLRLSEDGRVSLKERTTYWGAPAAYVRSNFATTERKALEEGLGKYVTTQYKAKKLTSMQFSEPDDLARPFSLDLTAEGVELGYFSGEAAQVQLQVLPLFHDLPEELRDADEAAEGLSAELKDKKRTVDFVYSLPYVYELVYRIVPAHGFVVQALPPAETISFGPARLQFTCTSSKEGTVEARYRLESGKARITADELSAFQTAFKDYLKSPVQVVQFSLAAEDDLQAGRMKSALAAFRRLDREHPNTAHHTAQVARALLLAGLGEAARREARRAVEIDSKSPEALLMLGTVLEHDLLGRAMKPGFDRAGAEAAFRKVLEIDPAESRAIRELALIAEYDDDGEHSWPAAHLEQAKAFHERYQKLNDKSSDDDLNYLITLFRLGRYQQVLEKVHTLSQTVGAQALALAATVLLKTPAEAIRQGAVLAPDAENRPEAFRMAAAELLALRRYPESVVLFTEAARNHKLAAGIRVLIEWLRETKRHETLVLDDKDPRQLVAAFFATLASDDGDPRRYLAPEELPQGFDVSTLRRGFRIGLRKAADLPVPAQFDILVSRERVQEGDARWGVWVRSPVASPSDGYFVVPRNGHFRLLGLTADVWPALGREALRRIDQHDLDGARYLLGKMEEQLRAPASDDPLGASFFDVLWNRGDRQDEKVLRLLALSVQSDPASYRAMLPLAESRLSGTSGPVHDACELMLADLLMRSGRQGEARARMESLAKRFPSSKTAQLRLAALAMAGREWDKAAAIAESLLQKTPSDLPAINILSSTLAARDRWAEATAVFRKGLSSGERLDSVHNQIAWSMLYSSSVEVNALDHARRAVSLSQRRNEAHLHTLATVLAETGNPEEARQTLLELFELAGYDSPRDIDWYIIGRIAEEYGEREAALSAYRKVLRPAGFNPFSTYHLAERRLRLLESRK